MMNFFWGFPQKIKATAFLREFPSSIIGSDLLPLKMMPSRRNLKIFERKSKSFPLSTRFLEKVPLRIKKRNPESPIKSLV